jgi:hypothetical protein
MRAPTFVICACLQVLLTLPLEGPPVRFGVPLPAAAVAKGLRLEGHGVLQWRRLPVGGDSPDPVWVELAICGIGTGKVVAGGAAVCIDGNGPACVREETHRREPHGPVQQVAWRWRDGTIDERERTEFDVDAEIGGETFRVGEALTRFAGGIERRADVWCRLPRGFVERAGLLPAAGGCGETLRRQLAVALPALRELPGVRGAGDFARSGGVVTNLEFDSTFALLRCAVAFGDRELFALAGRCARHLRDRDLDVRTGLPFPHGPDHRTGVPEPGHAWLQGLLWVGLMTADDGLLDTARTIGMGLATRPPNGEGHNERARDFAWPLLELEAPGRQARRHTRRDTEAERARTEA